jgi:hypothetical protein
MVPPALLAYAGETGRHRELCQKMHERFRSKATANDAERCLKMMLLVESGPELPPETVQKFLDSFSGELTEHNRAWFLAAAGLLACRQADYAKAHERVDEALTLESKESNNFIRAAALGVRTLIFARQQEVAQARKSLEHLKQVMSQDLKMSWKADGSLDPSTILKGANVEHDKLIPEILRREAEQLLPAAAAGVPSPQSPEN